MFGRFRQRSEELENLDRGSYTPEEYEGCLVELRRINRWLGDTGALRRSVLADIGRDLTGNGREPSGAGRAGGESFTLLDVGAGSGELLRVAARWARARELRARLVGLELNARAARSILEESRAFPEIDAVRGDALGLPFADGAFDYCMCSLFAHHFRDEALVAVLRELSRVARRRVYVLDLHRHPVAYYFYTTAGRLFLRNRLIREDGALSILRAFTPAELSRLAARAGLGEGKVERRFPYRLVMSGAKK